MTAERYLEQQAKRSRVTKPTLSPLDFQDIPLRDAPSAFRARLHAILHQEEETLNLDKTLAHDRSSVPSSLGKVVFNSFNVPKFDTSLAPLGLDPHAATIIGSSQQGKTTLLNSLLNLFGFLYPHPVFPDIDLLPTHTHGSVGLPFPLRLEYGPKYEIFLQRWKASNLENVMCKVVESVLAENSDFFKDLEVGLEEVTSGSFLEFVAKHRLSDEESKTRSISNENEGLNVHNDNEARTSTSDEKSLNYADNSRSSTSCGNQCLNDDEDRFYFPSQAAIENLNADGGVEHHDFSSVEEHVHQAVQDFLVHLVEDSRWFYYERITLKCPSQLLKYLKSEIVDTYILDLPGVGIVDDNNLLVEELVLRDMMEAATVIILTGERSFTHDVIRVLKNSVFERLLDPSVVPRPTVAITNSRNLRGLKEEEMEKWRSATLNGNLGWNTELKAFANDAFSGRRHREIETLEPDLFPNDLEGFLDSKKGSCEKGVSRLVGYLLRLPQEALIASVGDVLDRARSVMGMVDKLWQSESVTWQGLRSCRLKKEIKQLRDEEFKRDLDAELTITAQRKIFGFEMAVTATQSKVGFKSLEPQMHYMEELFREQRCKLSDRLKMMKPGKNHPKQEITKMVKESLLQIASQWDENVGMKAFRQFLYHAQEITKSLYRKWARKLFLGGKRDSKQDEKQERAYQFMVDYLIASAADMISEDNFKYTLTHNFRQHAWNLDLKDFTKMGLRKGRSTSLAIGQIEVSVQTILKSKEVSFKECMQEHMSLQSASIQELIRLLKRIILVTFEDCEKNFGSVVSALENIAKGKLAINDDPVVILRKDLEVLAKCIEKYLGTLKQKRDIFGAEELEKVLQVQV